MLSPRILGFLLPVACSAAIYENFADLPKLDFDYIIVGGGTAGNVLANRLTEQKDTSVLVLEAGQSTADVLVSQVPFFCPQATPNTPLDWNFTTTPQPGFNGRAISYPRGFGLGGSSAVSESSSLNCYVFLIDIVKTIWSTPVDRLRTTIDMRA